MQDLFTVQSIDPQKRLESPVEDGFDITPDDTDDLSVITRAIYIGGTGDVVVLTKGGSTITLTGLPTGMLFPIRAKRILATGTTATSLVGLY